MNTPVSVIKPGNVSSVVPTTIDGASGFSNTDNTFRDPVTGAPALRSSQTLNTEFFDAIWLCYKNLAWSPSLIFLFMLINVVSFAMILGAEGPIHSLNKTMALVMNDEHQLGFVRTVAKWLYLLTLYLLKPLILKLITVQVLLWIPYLAKPSTKNLYIMVLLTLSSFIFIDVDLLLWLLISHLWFIYVEIRNPGYKIFIMIVFVLYFVFAWVDLSDAIIKSAKDEYDMIKLADKAHDSIIGQSGYSIHVKGGVHSEIKPQSPPSIAVTTTTTKPPFVIRIPQKPVTVPTTTLKPRTTTTRKTIITTTSTPKPTTTKAPAVVKPTTAKPPSPTTKPTTTVKPSSS